MQFIALTLLAFAVMEAVSYIAHRWLFHGVFWKLHRSHHFPRKGRLELNDVFSIAFALISISLLVFAGRPLGGSVAFPIGLGMALYGFLYFLVHDIVIHRRFLRLAPRSRVILSIRNAHQRHHQSLERSGQEPYGLLVYNYSVFREKRNESAG